MHFYIGVEDWNLLFDFSIGYAYFHLSVNQPGNTWTLGINIVPLIAMFYLKKIFFPKERHQMAVTAGEP